MSNREATTVRDDYLRAMREIVLGDCTEAAADVLLAALPNGGVVGAVSRWGE